MDYGVDRYKRPQPLSAEREGGAPHRARGAPSASSSTICGARCRAGAPSAAESRGRRVPAEPEENILYFVEKHSPRLAPWQRELVRIVRKLAQYFYPQTQTKVMNEGWATFWHYTLLNRLYEKRMVDDAFMFEFLHNHTNVVSQRRLRRAGLSRHQPVCAGLRHDAGHPPHLREADRRGSRLVPRAGRHRLAQGRSTSPCATSRTNPSSRSTCRRA